MTPAQHFGAYQPKKGFPAQKPVSTEELAAVMRTLSPSQPSSSAAHLTKLRPAQEFTLYVLLPHLKLFSLATNEAFLYFHI